MQTKKIKATSFIVVLVVISYLLFHNLDQDLFQLQDQLQNRPILYSILNVTLLALDAILPIPSSILMFLNGKVLGIVSGTSISIIGVSLGSFFAYKIGYNSNKILNIGVHYKLSQKLLSNYGILTLMITRGIPVISEIIIIYAGIQKRNLKQVLIYSTLGYIPLCLVYVILGSTLFQTKGFLIALASSTLFSIVTIFIVDCTRKKNSLRL